MLKKNFGLFVKNGKYNKKNTMVDLQ
jgi:hypothetical protein